MRIKTTRLVIIPAVLSVFLFFGSATAVAQADNDNDEAAAPQIIPNTGQLLTPAAPYGTRFESLNPNLPDFPEYVAGQAVTTVVSPDKKTLLILTSGYNLLNVTSGPGIGTPFTPNSTEYVFVFDISNKIPVKKQVLKVPNTYNGIVFDPSGTSFYVSGGVDDNVHVFDLQSAVWTERAGSPIALGHNANGLGLAVKPEAAGIAISADGNTLVVADYYNDAVSILTKQQNQWSKTGELDLRPGKIDPVNSSGVPGGEYPFWVVVKGNTTAYVSSIRDREIDVVNLLNTPSVTGHIKVVGQPNKMILNTAQTLLLVAEDQTDTVDVIDTSTGKITYTVPVGAPAGLLPPSRAKYTGHNTNSLTLSNDEKTLYVTNGNTNEVSVVSIASSSGQPAVAGLIPTGWYPNSVSLSGDDKYMYVVNGKSPTDANPGDCHGETPTETSACAGTNQYDLQLIKAGFQSFPTPTADQLSRLTQQVAENNHFSRTLTQSQQSTMAFLRSKIKHVIFIIKENRTYDQVLGDLRVGNGDPDLTEFGQGTTPNLHNLASNFVTLDNFYDRSEVSMDGWPWTTSARAPDVVERQVTVNYAGRGLSNDSEGTNRNVNVGYESLAERLKANPLTPNDPDLLPGRNNAAAPDGPNHEMNQGYIWNDALRAGLSIRNYGFFIDLVRYNLPTQYASSNIPELRMPFATKTPVAYSTSAALRPYTDPYFRGFDNSLPDYWRYQEWAREFEGQYASAGLPQLEFVRFMHDHTGNFDTAIDGVNTVDLQEADNDYAVGLLVEKISKSAYKNNTLIFVIEDDSQDGADHVDAHRSIAFIVGPYVKQGQLVSTAYNTVDFVRTIEEVLGLKPLNLNDSLAVPMADVFDQNQSSWNFTATPSALLANTALPIPSTQFAGLKPFKPTHDSTYWAEVTKGMDFSAEDRIDFAKYNHILWRGMMGDRPYPEIPSGANLRRGREKLLNLQSAQARVQ